MSAKYKEFQNFTRKLEQLNGSQKDEFMTEAVKELAARLLAKVTKRTPVGQKHGGTLRRGWTVGEVQKNGSSYTIEVIDPVEYASYVEYGHRTPDHQGWVEGRFMLTVSEQEIRNAMPKILEMKLTKFLKGIEKT